MKNKILTTALLTVAATLAGSAFAARPDHAGKPDSTPVQPDLVPICHFYGDGATDYNVITVSSASAEAHIEMHGDLPYNPDTGECGFIVVPIPE